MHYYNLFVHFYFIKTVHSYFIILTKETAQLLKSMGYEVQLALIATKPKLSYLSTLIRYEELYAINPDQARATPKEHHDFIVNYLVDNTRQLEKLAIFERIQIYQRDRSCVYDSEEDKTSVATVLHDLLFGEWNQVEKEMLKSGEERLKDLTNRNGYSLLTQSNLVDVIN